MVDPFIFGLGLGLVVMSIGGPVHLSIMGLIVMGISFLGKDKPLFKSEFDKKTTKKEVKKKK